MKKIIYLLAILIMCTSSAYAGVGGPHLWLSTDPNNFNEGGVGYIGSSSDPWMTDSYLLNNGARLYLYNASKTYDATNVALMVAIHSYESGWVSIKDEFGNTTLISSFPETDITPYYGGGNHGVYEPHDGIFAVYYPSQTINLAPQTYTYFNIYKGPAELTQVHFDAFSENGFYNPASHDATMTPEPATLSLVWLGLLGFGVVRRKKRVKQGSC